MLQGRLTLKSGPQEFVWGTPVQVHSISRYEIVEYEPYRPLTVDQIEFHVYIGGEDARTSWPSLETALLYCIAQEHLNVNDARVMVPAIARMVQLPEGRK